MSNKLDLGDPAALGGKPGQFSALMPDRTGGAMAVINESPYGVDMAFNGSSYRVPADSVRTFRFSPTQTISTPIQWIVANSTNPAAAPISDVTVEFFGQDEDCTVDIQPIIRQTNVGNPVTTNNSLTNLEQDLATPFVDNGLVATRDQWYPTIIGLAVNGGASLLRYFRLDEASGTTVIDSSGHGQNGTTHGAPTQGVAGLLAGDPDTCYTLAAASSQFISIPTTGLPTGNAPFSYGALFKFAANPAASTVIMGFGGTASLAGCTCWIDTTGKLNCDLNLGTGQITSPAAVLTGVAHFVVVTWNGTTLTLYLDGVSQGTSTPGALALVGTSCNIGANNSNTSFYTGQVDEAAYWGAALTLTQVNALYTSAKSATAQLDVSAGLAFLRQSDGSIQRQAAVAATYAAGAANTTYYLDFNPDGSWSWATTHSVAGNYLPIAQATTDGSGNLNVITDMRQLYTTLFPGQSGGLLGNLASGPLQAFASSLTLPASPTRLCSVTAPVAGVYLLWLAVSVFTVNATFAPTFSAYGYRNGVAIPNQGNPGASAQAANAGQYGATVAWCYSVRCNAGDTLELWWNGNGGTSPSTAGQLVAQYLHT